MDIEILRGFCWGGGRDVYPGDTVRGVDPQRAHELIQAGKAREVVVKKTPELIEIRDPEPEHRDPRPASKKRR